MIVSNSIGDVNGFGSSTQPVSGLSVFDNVNSVNAETGQPLPKVVSPTWEQWASMHTQAPDGYKPVALGGATDDSGFSQAAQDNLLNTMRYNSTPEQRLYSDVASGKVQLSPSDFDKLITSDKGLITPTEFNALPPDVQAQARANPQLFLQSVMQNQQNTQTNDLLSLNAQGGYRNFNNVTWDPNTGLKFNSKDYMTVDNGIDPGLAIMGLLAGGFGALAFAPEAAAAGGAATTGGTSASNFALADAAQLSGQGLSQAQIAATMAGNGVTGTGGMFAGTGGLVGTTGNAVADAALNGAIRGGLTSAIRGGDPLSGAVMGGVGGGWSNYVGDLGNPVLNGAANAVPGAVISGNPTGILTGAVSGGLNQFGRSVGLDPTVSGALGSAGASAVGSALSPQVPITQTVRPNKPSRAVYDPTTGSVKLV